MAMSEADRVDATRQLARKIFVEAKATATFSTADLKAAIDAIDDGFDSLVSSHLSTDTIEVALNKLLPQPFKSNATVVEKSLLVAVTATKRYG